MATFSPTLQFPKRWLNTPNPVKQVFHQELDDIIHMLGSAIDAKDYQFTHQDFDKTVSELINKYQEEYKEPAKLVHSIDTTPLSQQTHHNFSTEELHDVEQRIHQKLSVQLDDFLSEHIAQLSEDLKDWVAIAIKNELAEYQPTHQKQK